MGLQMF